MRETASGRRQAPRHVASILDAARELRIRDAQVSRCDRLSGFGTGTLRESSAGRWYGHEVRYSSGGGNRRRASGPASGGSVTHAGV